MTYVDALQTALAAEHAALYVVGVLGAQTSESGSPALYAALRTAYTDHRGRRDVLVRTLRDQEVEPVAAEPAYEMPADLSSEDAVTRRALRLERACAASYAYLVASSPGPERRWAVTALQMTAVRELDFRGTPEMFPGGDEYADR